MLDRQRNGPEKNRFYSSFDYGVFYIENFEYVAEGDDTMTIRRDSESFVRAVTLTGDKMQLFFGTAFPMTTEETKAYAQRLREKADLVDRMLDEQEESQLAQKTE